MHRFFTPLLRRVYFVAALILAIYWSAPPLLRSTWNKERLYRHLLSGEKEAKIQAASGLAQYDGQDYLIRALQSDSGSVREAAAAALADLWFNAAEDEAKAWLQTALQSVEQREFRRALIQLTALTRNYPGYAEGWNRRAVIFWHLGQYERAIEDCRRVVLLNPENFFAWQEMGLCQIRLGNYGAATRALRNALQINPHDRTTQRLLKRSEEMLKRGTQPEVPAGEIV